MNDTGTLFPDVDENTQRPRNATLVKSNHANAVLVVPEDDMRKIDRIAAELAVTRECECETQLLDRKVGSFWKIERRDEIQIVTTANGVALVQVSPLGESENQRVDVLLERVIALARRMLWAAGSTAITFTEDVDGDDLVLHDGDTADLYYDSEEDAAPAR
jgi:hypothetical protein